MLLGGMVQAGQAGRPTDDDNGQRDDRCTIQQATYPKQHSTDVCQSNEMVEADLE